MKKLLSNSLLFLSGLSLVVGSIYDSAILYYVSSISCIIYFSKVRKTNIALDEKNLNYLSKDI